MENRRKIGADIIEEKLRSALTLQADRPITSGFNVQARDVIQSKFSEAGQKLQQSTQPKPVPTPMASQTFPIDSLISENIPQKQPEGAQLTPNMAPATKDPAVAIGGKDKKEVRKSIISNFRQTGEAPEISDKQAKKVEYILSDPSKMQQRLEKDSGVSGAFAQALLGFLPTIAGAIFGGDEGGAAGAQVGLKALEGYQSILKDERKEAFEQQKLAQDATQFSENLESLETREIFQQSSQDERLKMQLRSQEKLAQQEQSSRERIASAEAFQKGVQAQAESGQGNLKAFEDRLEKFRSSKPFVDMATSASTYERFNEAYKLPPSSARTFTLMHSWMKLHDPTSAVLTSEFKSAKEALAAIPQLQREGKIDIAILEKLKSAIKGEGVPEQYLDELKNMADSNIKGQAKNLRAHTVDLNAAGDVYNIPQEIRAKLIGENFIKQQATYAGEPQLSNRRLQLEKLRQLKQSKGNK